MAFFRFTRDKRGYEYFSLVEPVTNRRGKTRPRVLYWYRTPPNVRVGRPPFDEAVRCALEKQNPTVAFDWAKIIGAPIPSADVERWRERRRTERAEKAARQQHTSLAADLDDSSAEIDEPASISQEAPLSAPPEAVQAPSVTGDQVRKRKRRRRMRGQRPDLSGRQGSLGDGELDQSAVRTPDSAPAAAPTDTPED